MIVYVSIGNSDDKLSQVRWSAYVQDVSDAIADQSLTRHGEWFSAPSSAWQNACWCVDLFTADAPLLRGELERLAAVYGQESIAWAVAEIELLRPPATP